MLDHVPNREAHFFGPVDRRTVFAEDGRGARASQKNDDLRLDGLHLNGVWTPLAREQLFDDDGTNHRD